MPGHRAKKYGQSARLQILKSRRIGNVGRARKWQTGACLRRTCGAFNNSNIHSICNRTQTTNGISSARTTKLRMQIKTSVRAAATSVVRAINSVRGSRAKPAGRVKKASAAAKAAICRRMTGIAVKVSADVRTSRGDFPSAKGGSPWLPGRTQRGATMRRAAFFLFIRQEEARFLTFTLDTKNQRAGTKSAEERPCVSEPSRRFSLQTQTNASHAIKSLKTRRRSGSRQTQQSANPQRTV